jgi:alpha-D-ribose 1-methylphosphonate 5-triphosphate diphosphatase
VVLGAPNALKGGSLYDRLSVREAVKEGLCTVLASDYYYPSLVHAPFLMDSLGILSLADGWKLVSENPAKAVGLFDRGSLSVGKRADIIVVEPQRDGSVQVVATFVNGRLVHAAQPLD